jgi:hypothetical protein
MAMIDKLYIGGEPWGEPGAQVGRPDYMVQARKDCRRFKEQILRHYPIPDGVRARLIISVNPHDFGTYLSVDVQYDDTDERAVDYAFKVESDPLGKLENWDENI